MGLSIVIPAYNESQFILKTINRIVHVLEGKLSYEIIVVNNGSQDDTESILKPLDKIKVINFKKKETISVARNRGSQEAAYETLAFIDADVLITEDWAEEIIDHIKDIEKTPYQITGCRYVLSENPSWIENVWFKHLKSSKSSYINSGNLITSKHVMNSLSGFNEKLPTGEDVDFCKRAVDKGIRLNINPRYIAHHEGYPRTLKRFFQRERWHGAGDFASVKAFLKSRVALFSFSCTALIIISTTLLLMGEIKYGIKLALIFSAVNSVAMAKRFKITGLTHALILFFLHSVYCVARTTSFMAKRHR